MTKKKAKVIKKTTEEDLLLQEFGRDIVAHMKTAGDHKRYWKVRLKRLEDDTNKLKKRSK